MSKRAIGRRLFCVMLALLLALPAMGHAAETHTKWSYQYEILEDDSARIVKYRGSNTSLAIPEELDGHPVTAIGDGAFDRCIGLVSVGSCGVNTTTLRPL